MTSDLEGRLRVGLMEIGELAPPAPPVPAEDGRSRSPALIALAACAAVATIAVSATLLSSSSDAPNKDDALPVDAAAGADDDTTGASALPSRADLEVAIEVITAAAARNEWPITSVGYTADLEAGLIVEVIRDKVSPELKDEIASLVEIPVAFKLVEGKPIDRPARWK